VFWVDLPLEPVDGWRVRALSLTGIRAAIVNASPLLAGALGAALKALGATVVDAEDQPDVALVDNIPSLSAEAIAALSARAVIALAPQEDRSAIVAARALGVKHYLIKPARRRSLGERVLIALGDRRGLDMDAAEEEDEPAQTPLGARVLLAEDNPINALLARTLLQRQGCSVDVVGDGEEAVAALSERHYDLVFLDLRMPRLDGMGAARRIRALGPDKARTPLVALTADSSDEDRVAALAAGFDEFVAKPIDMNRLADVTARFTRAAKAATLAR
jgi:CheY-like chemotaxis protein